MERKSKLRKEHKQNFKNTKESFFTELHKVQSKKERKNIKITENKLMIQLHHFDHLKKSITTNKTAALNLIGDSKALLENDYFKLIKSKECKISANNTDLVEFIPKPLILNKVFAEDTVPCDNNKSIFKQIEDDYRRIKQPTIENKKCTNIKEIVYKKLNNKLCNITNPFSLACRNINSIFNIKDYNTLFSKKIIEGNKFINGILIYNDLKEHFAGTPVARTCIKRKFFNRLNMETEEKTLMTNKTSSPNPKETDSFLQNIMDYYEEQKNENNSEIDESKENMSFECQEVLDCCVTPEYEMMEYFSPDSYQTPPSQRLIPVDSTATTPSKYQTMYYEKNATNGDASLFEIPDNFDTSNLDKNLFKRIDLSQDINIPSCSGISQIKKNDACDTKIGTKQNDLEIFANSSPKIKQKHTVKKCLFHITKKKSEHLNNDFEFLPIKYSKNDEKLFVRPMFSPKQFNELNSRVKKNKTLSVYSRDVSKRKCLQELKVDEFDYKNEILTKSTLSDFCKIKTPEHKYYPYVQYDRK